MCKTRFGRQGVILDGFKTIFSLQNTFMANAILNFHFSFGNPSLSLNKIAWTRLRRPRVFQTAIWSGPKINSFFINFQTISLKKEKIENVSGG